MADVITRLKVESSEYDSKIQRAAKGLQHLEAATRSAGKTMADASKEEIEFTRAIGQMETVSNDAKGKIGELTKAFTNLSVQYNNLTKQEKQSPYGKALAGSLDQLKGRIKDSKSELSKVEGSLNGFGDVAKQAAGKLGLPIEQLAKFGPYGAAAAVAIKVAADAFKQNELLMDEWGRETEEAKSIYTGFLNALNTGDFSSFFSNINKIRASARAAYDALDELGTFNAFNQIQTEKARTNFTEAATNFREGTGSEEDVRAAADALKTELQTRQEKEQKTYLAAIDNLAATRGVDKQLLEQVLKGDYGSYEEIKMLVRLSQQGGTRRRGRGGQQSEGAQRIAALSEMLNKLSDEELQRIQGLGAQAQRTATEVEQIDKQMVRILGGKDNKTASSKAKELNPMEEAQKKIAELSNEALTADDARKEAIRGEIDLLQKEIAKYKEIQDYVLGIKKTTEEGAFNPAGPDRSPLEKLQNSIRIQQADQASALDSTTLNNLLGLTVKNNISGFDADFSGIMAKMFNGDNIPDSVWQDLADKINEKLKELNLAPIELDVKTGGVKELQKDVAKTTDHVAGAAQAFEALGNAMGQIEDPGAKVAGLIANAIASIASGYGQAVAQAGNGSAGGPWGWIAFAISGLATMISVIAGVKSATAGSYANGGKIPGNSFSGDNMRGVLPNGDLIGLDAGEVVLNRAQQSNLAGQLQGNNPMGNLRLSTEISGSNLRVVLNNDNRQRGGSRNVYGVH